MMFIVNTIYFSMTEFCFSFTLLEMSGEGSEYILDNQINKEELINKELHITFKPEFINRIDEIIIFNSLNKDIVYQILDKIIKDIEKRLSDKKININLTDKAKEFIINNSYDEEFGARPIKRYVSRNLETILANEIINDNIKFNCTIEFDANDKLYISNIN